MNYISELNQFFQYLQTSDLSPSARLLWYSLMGVANGTRWKPVFNVPMSTLIGLTGLSQATIRRARKELEKAGLLKVTVRPGCQASIYRLCPLDGAFAAHNDRQNELAAHVAAHSDWQPERQNAIAAHVDAHSDWQPERIHKQNKTVLNKTRQGTAVVDDQTWKEVLHFFESNIHTAHSLKERQDLEADVSDYGEIWVKAAIEEAVDAGAFNMNYIEAVLKAWKAKGHMTRRKDRKKDQIQSDEAIRQADLVPF
ncbi:DnaD domain protein [Acidaminococcus timonensis]|uniref:DnaD domain protein n=1 Tax=Acidaminococcus timonensis TaxID=1871002 RepID=UPI00307EE07B